MGTLLVSHQLNAQRGGELARAVQDNACALRVVALPEDREARLPADACASIEVAFFSGDLFPAYSRQFFSAVRKAPNLKWLHAFNVGVDHPIYTEMLERGVRITTSAGSTAVPIAQTAITGLLMLARNFPRWLAGQRDHKWDPMYGSDVPRDLPGQTALIIGVGQIGTEIARLARMLGLTVIGVRRSALEPDDPVDELHTPEHLRALLPRADWLILAAPLTAETRGLVNADALSRLPQGAKLINIARGEVVDEPALIEALRSGHLAGAYLDVFEREPLPPDSPLWDLPNVLVTPHNSPAASGNNHRVYDIFVKNLGRWARGEPLLNEVAHEAPLTRPGGTA